MNTLIQCRWMIICQLVCMIGLMAQPAEHPQTFCNPLNLNYRFMVDAEDAREAADAVVVLFQDDYYLFASRSGGYWVSSDFLNWELVVPTGLDVETYAPAIVAMRDSLFYIPSANSQIYRSGDPKAGIWEKGPRVNSYGDPAFFADDDGRLFMYYGLAQFGPISVVELDPLTFEEIGPAVTILSAQADIHGWERRGDTNLQDEAPWIEGSWMIKDNGRYYLHYAGPGTEFKTYADGIYEADSPTGPFEYAPYSPFAFKPTGFICGAGHGSTFMDKHGQYWHIGTMTISVQAMFERRLGVYPVTFDADGQIRCQTVFGDYPYYLPGVKENMVENVFTGMMLLSHKKYAMASSAMEEHGIELAIDEEARTYWCAQSGDPGEWYLIDLGTECSVEGVQVNFAEHQTNPDLVRGRDVLIYEQYTIESSTDGIDWNMLIDKSENLEDVPHDYTELAGPVTARYIRCTNVFTPGDGYFAIRDLRIFGNSDKAVITAVNDFTVERDPSDGRDAVVRWDPVENADGYIVNYGIASDKLYNNYMVYDADSISIHSLNHGTEYYFEVKAFDNGTDYYQQAGEFRSSRSGDWNEPSVWSWHDGTDWVTPAPRAPSAEDGPITIAEGDSVTVTVPDTVDQLSVASGGVLIVRPGIALHFSDDVGPDLQAEGDVINEGNITAEAQATLNFLNGGMYVHQQDGGVIPSATWWKGATCELNSIVNEVPSNANQDFHHVVWNCPGQSGNMSLKWNGNTIGGNLIIENTGTGRWQMCAPAEGEEALIHIGGDIIQSDGQFSSNGTGNANTTIIIHQQGNIGVTGGSFAVSRGSQGGSGTTTWYVNGDVSVDNATVQNSNPGGALLVFKNTEAVQSLSLTNVTYGGGGFPVQVDSGAALNIGTSILEGSGSFVLKPGSMLITGHETGVDGSLANTGTRILDPAAGYGFNGTVTQITGDAIPPTLSDLLIDNVYDVTLSKSLMVTGQLEMKRGNIVSDMYQISYGPDGSLLYSGATGQTTSDMEFPPANGPASLCIANVRSVELHASRGVKTVDLQGKLSLETFTLTTDHVSNATDRTYADTRDGGALRIRSVGSSTVYYPVGTSNLSPVWITNSGTPDTLAVSVIKDDEIAPSDGRVRLKYTLQEDTPGGGDYTVQLGWSNANENTQFRQDRESNAKIYNLETLMEAGSGPYSTQLDDLLRTVSRSGITELGSFVIGDFSGMSDIDERQEEAPSVFALYPNYPNPFNPETTIHFSVGEASEVRIAVYDLLGRHIDTLIDKTVKAGSHRVIWNGEHQASGIYFVKIITKQYVKSRKMVLLR